MAFLLISLPLPYRLCVVEVNSRHTAHLLIIPFGFYPTIFYRALIVDSSLMYRHNFLYLSAFLG